MGRRGKSAPARLVRLTCQRKQHRCMMSCCGSWCGSQGLLLACRLPAALSTAGHAPSSPPRSTPMACHRRLRDRRLRDPRLRAGVATSLLSSKHGLHEHNSFFSSAARGWQMAACGTGDPFDCGRRARKSRWKAAPAQNRRGSSCWFRKSRCWLLRAWDTQGLFARSRLRGMLRPRPHQRSPRQAHRHRRPRQPCHRYRRQRRFPVRRRRRPRCHRRRPLTATWPPPSPSASPSPPRPTPPSPWPSPSPPSPSPSPLPLLPSPLSPPPPPSPPSPLSRDAAPLSFDRASSRRFDRCA